MSFWHGLVICNYDETHPVFENYFSVTNPSFLFISISPAQFIFSPAHGSN